MFSSPIFTELYYNFMTFYATNVLFLSEFHRAGLVFPKSECLLDTEKLNGKSYGARQTLKARQPDFPGSITGEKSANFFFFFNNLAFY